MVYLLLAASAFSLAGDPLPERFQPIGFNNPGLTTDLGMGLWGWPIPVKGKNQGRPDLILVAGGSPTKGTYYYENMGTIDPKTGLDLFKKPVLLGAGKDGATPSYTPAGLRVLTAGQEYPDFLQTGCDKPVALGVDAKSVFHLKGKERTSQWSYVDYDGDGKLDLVVGIDDWSDYGWDSAYDAQGNWTKGPLHGLVFLLKNTGTNDQPVYAAPVQIEADGKPIDVYGRPSPVFGDFTGSGKLDLICGEFLDGDGINDLVTVDQEGYLAFYRQVVREGKRVLLPGQRIFQMKGNSVYNAKNEPQGGGDGPLRLNNGTGGESGRRTFCFVDWDGDGKLDLLVNSRNVTFFRNISTKPGEWLFEDDGPVDGRKLAGHSTSPTPVNWNHAALSGLLVGAEDGLFYYLDNPHDHSTPSP